MKDMAEDTHRYLSHFYNTNAKTQSRTEKCPTCNGTGKLVANQDELVALIPYGDSRLKPRRTKLIIGVTVVICLGVAILLTFLLFPRDISISTVNAQSESVFISNKTNPYISVLVTLKIQNKNYLSSTISQINLKASYADYIVGYASPNAITIAPLSTVTLNATVVTKYTKRVATKLKYTCSIGNWPHYVLELFETTAQCSTVFQSFATSTSFATFIDCHESNSVVPVHHEVKKG
ncbi:Transmembrane protein 106A [Trichoplax sp. H2]|nr:Transmembrane protein 106A [Trichoplax sp. H2]|eukprot:RDD38585.1 Transmembrane protein 106A [Trichoplax sp. H2]